MPTSDLRVINIFFDPSSLDGKIKCRAEPYHVVVPISESGRPCRMLWNLITVRGMASDPVATFPETDGIKVGEQIQGGEPWPMNYGRRTSTTQWVIDNANVKPVDGPPEYHIFRYDVYVDFGSQLSRVQFHYDPTVINSPDPNADPQGRW